MAAIDIGPGPYGSRGYNVARKLRVPKQGQRGDEVPQRPERSG